MPEMHLKQPGFTYSACDPLTKNKERIEKFMQTWDTILFMKMNLMKLVFKMIWVMAKKKDLVKRTQSDTVLKDKAFKIDSYPKYVGYQRGLSSTVYKFFDKKSCGSGIATYRQLLESLKKEKFIHHLETISGVLI